MKKQPVSGRHRFPRGEDNPAAVLTAEDVLELRRLSTRGYRHRELAAMVGCSRRNVSAILAGESWQHLSEESACA